MSPIIPLQASQRRKSDTPHFVLRCAVLEFQIGEKKDYSIQKFLLNSVKHLR